ncbi:histidine kinase [Streptomyces sp. NPDC093252]|uniref:sensor histidine kinase n=1 Tax=Streptomyces sp. NPDC093252 TaxID=3154980 RepID=UPI00343AE0AC
MGEPTGPAVTVLGAVPFIAAAGTLVWAVARRRAGVRGRLGRLARPAAVCAALSLITGFAVPTAGGDGDAGAGAGWKLAESAVLLLLLAAVTRWSPPRELLVVVPLIALAVTLWPLPLVTGESFLEAIGIAAFWLVPVIAAVAAGAYPRRQELRRRRAVAETRSALRLHLSRDLHDFVAHDISGIVVQAQAARFVAATDPSQAVLALERIERAGLSALAAMDRTVQMLHGPEESTTTRPLPDVSQLPSLVADFTAAGGTEARLDLPPEAARALSRAAGAAAYRIVVEALTNVRRHAPGAARADIVFRVTPTTVELRVTNDRGTRPAPVRRRAARGGLGLPALTEHARALGGTLSAGPHGDGGWRLTAALPVTPPDEN